MTKPTPTTCIAISLEIPKEAQTTGIRSKEPPATPEAPQAPTVAIKDNNNRHEDINLNTKSMCSS